MKDIYFISDAHLGTDFKNCSIRKKYLTLFLSEISLNASDLFIVGDLFDFWIEYKHVIRSVYFPILHQLKKLSAAGIQLHYLAGNHDFALGSFLRKEIGMEIYADHLDITLQEKKIHLYHGDGMLQSDSGYRFLRKVLRNPINQFLYKLLHPDIAIPLATLCSLISRNLVKKKFTEQKQRAYFDAAFTYLENGSDIMIMGHTHKPGIYDINGKIVCNTGDWLHQYTYARLNNGRITLWRYKPHEKPVEIKPYFEKPGKRESYVSERL
jgi:UDP-2,3-diacylglucosamine hydrolase